MTPEVREQPKPGERGDPSDPAAPVQPGEGDPSQPGTNTGGEATRPDAQPGGPTAGDVEPRDIELASFAPEPPKGLTRATALGIGTVKTEAGALLANGRKVPLVAPEGLRLYLPRGELRLAQGGSERPLSVAQTYAERYDEQRQRLTSGALLNAEAIIRQKVAELDHPEEVFLLNLAAATYMQRKAWAAARRHLVRALRIEPGFPPAHLNLAFVLAELDDAEGAKAELRLAEALDCYGAWGLERGFAALRSKLSWDKRPPVEWQPQRYAASLPTDDRVANACILLAKLAKTPVDAVAALNNAGLQLLSQQRYEGAYEVFMAALAQLAQTTPTERGRLVAATIYGNLARLYEEADWPEATEGPVIASVFPRPWESEKK